MEQLQQQTQQLTPQLQQQTTTMQQMQQQMIEVQAQLKSATAASSRDPQPAFAVDARVIGKPREFDGDKDRKDWSIVMHFYAAACHEQLGTLMRTAELSEDRADN
eukprot:4702318-Pyramimonas_sp.AAC.1